jgi:hypothetical protein
LIQDQWLAAITRQQLQSLIPLAEPVAVEVPEIGQEIYSSFGWVERIVAAD